ncbi:hypothetical protein PsorP6_011652 [Peronosclerospora sorghi]|uniref:Uncharacterized protein n=1 Tax=Peronosclerospora sorghi TaxID=230839 RepID=A0ACC0WK40_9STRA|nr:hypothetical protein PsorP6_011652 [Peronosclerospora sorghi]
MMKFQLCWHCLKDPGGFRVLFYLTQPQYLESGVVHLDRRQVLNKETNISLNILQVTNARTVEIRVTIPEPRRYSAFQLSHVVLE